MTEEVELVLETTKEQMAAAVKHLSKEYNHIRTGKANPEILSNIMVDYYGTETSIKNAATLSASDGRTIIVQPFEKSMLSKVEKAIMDSDLGLNPQNNGAQIFINIPPLTEERRKELVKYAKKQLEEAKVSVRSARRDGNQELHDQQKEGLAEDEVKDGESRIEDLTKKYYGKLEKLFDEKEEEIMEV